MSWSSTSSAASCSDIDASLFWTNSSDGSFFAATEEAQEAERREQFYRISSCNDCQTQIQRAASEDNARCSRAVDRYSARTLSCVCKFGPWGSDVQGTDTNGSEKHCRQCQELSSQLYVPIDIVSNICQHCGLPRGAHEARARGSRGCAGSSLIPNLECPSKASASRSTLLAMLLAPCGVPDSSIDGIRAFLTFVFHTLDWASDILVIVETAGKEELGWASLFAGALLVGNLLMTTLAMSTVKKGKRTAFFYLKTACAILGLLHVYIYFEYAIRPQCSQSPDTSSTESREARDSEHPPDSRFGQEAGVADSADAEETERARRSALVVACKVLEAIVESAPQLILQLSFLCVQQLVHGQPASLLELSSVTLSFLSIGAAITQASSHAWRGMPQTVGSGLLVRLWQALDVALHASTYAVIVAAYRVLFLVALVLKVIIAGFGSALLSACLQSANETRPSTPEMSLFSFVLVSLGNAIATFPCNLGRMQLLVTVGVNWLLLTALQAAVFANLRIEPAKWDSTSSIVRGTCNATDQFEHCFPLPLLFGFLALWGAEKMCFCIILCVWRRGHKPEAESNQQQEDVAGDGEAVGTVAELSFS